LCFVKIKWIASSQPLVGLIFFLNLQIATSNLTEIIQYCVTYKYLHQLTYQVHVQCTFFGFVEVHQ